MPVPDILRPRRVDAKLALVQLGLTTVSALTCPANSIIRLRTVYIGNTTASTNVATISIYRAAIAAAVTLIRPSCTANTTVTAIAANDAVYLEPGDILQGISGANIGTLNLFVNYEIISA